MRKTSTTTHARSIDANLRTWCYEVGTRFEEVNRQAVHDFARYCESGQVIELGCGDGAAANEFLRLGYEYVGIDVNPGKLRRIGGGVTHCRDVLEWLYEQDDDSLPNIFAHHFLEHTVDVEKILVEIARTLAPGGIYYAVTPAHDYIHTVHFIAFEDAEELLPPGLELLHSGEQKRNEPEYYCVAEK